MKDLMITLSLTTDSKDDISIATINTQLGLGMKLSFSTPVQENDGKWTVWYTMPYTIWVEKVRNGQG